MNYILHGHDEGRVKQKINALKTKHHIENVIVFDATDDEQQDVFNEMDTISIFDDDKMIVIENATFLSSKNTTKYDIQGFIDRSTNDESVILVFCCPSDKLDTRKKVVKELVSKSTVYPCIALDEKSLPGYINEELKKLNLKMDRDAIKWFSARAGFDALRIEQELIKFKTFNDHITLKDVQDLMVCEPLNDVFKMVDALFERHALRLLAYYRNFRKLNMEPVAINGLLSGQIRFLFQVRVLMDQGNSKEEIARRLKAHPYRVQINMQRAYNFTSDELLEKLSILAKLDQDMKMGLVDKDEGFEQFILGMLQ